VAETLTVDLGDLPRATATFTVSGTAADPSVVKFSVLKPDGTLTTYVYLTDAQVVKTSTGIYYMNIDASQAGLWKVRAWSTGTGQAALESEFFVEGADAVASNPVARIPEPRVLAARSNLDGQFGVQGRVRMLPGVTLWWAVDLAGTQLLTGDNVSGFATPTVTGANAASMTVSDSGYYKTRVGFKLALSANALTTDVINIRCVITPDTGETQIIIVPVTVGG
jgi:hypothetical protein